MKKYNIQERVFKVNLKYARLQNKTKELFFKCLDEGRDVEYFKKKLYKLWKNTNTDYLEEQVEEYAEVIHEENVEGKKTEEVKSEEEGSIIFALIPFINVDKQKNKFLYDKTREYKRSYESPVYKANKKQYLSMKAQRYTSDTVPYYHNNKPIRKVKLSTYASMVYNSNATRESWNKTINDGDMIGEYMYYIPYHPFSCEHCVAHQEKVMTKAELVALAGILDTDTQEILHPNCQCRLEIYNDRRETTKSPYTEKQKQEYYDIKQKTNSLRLKKEELLSDIRIQKRLGEQEEVDKLNKKRMRINNSLKELKEELPEELRNELY